MNEQHRALADHATRPDLRKIGITASPKSVNPSMKSGKQNPVDPEFFHHIGCLVGSADDPSAAVKGRVSRVS